MKSVLILVSVFVFNNCQAQFLLNLKTKEAMDLIYQTKTVRSVDVGKAGGNETFQWRDSDTKGVVYQLIFNSKGIAKTYKITTETKDALGNMLVALDRDYKIVVKYKVWTTVMDGKIIKIMRSDQQDVYKYSFDFTIAD